MPPAADTVQLNGLPVVMPLVGHVTVTTRGCPATLTVADCETVTPLADVTLKVSVLVPLVGSVLLMVPVPVYGPVSPEAVTVQLNGLPTVTPDVGQETVTTNGLPWTLTVAEPDALTAFASVTVNDSVFVPLVGSVLLIVPVPVYGADPPVAVTVQLNGTPAVAVPGQDTVTTSG